MKNTAEISEHLREELDERLKRAGVKILEARLSHLAYAQEIAGVVLQSSRRRRSSRSNPDRGWCGQHGPDGA